jgi:S-DNA-T family DNA segregation ATPase FtsK/SpoIIIE
MKKLIIDTLKLYDIHATIGEIRISPTVSVYELILPRGSRINKLEAVLQDVARDIGVPSIRLMRNKKLYLEIPNSIHEAVMFADCIRSPDFMHSGRYDVLLGVDVFGKVTTADIRKMPHLLVAGATGSGKSVGIHSLINSLLIKNTPDSLQLILIDPKKTELSMYKNIPHLIGDVITEADEAANALEFLVSKMESRYEEMENADSRDMLDSMPLIVVVIDEMADLMLSGVDTIETNLIRLAQKARACGIHVIAATQRPSREVVTGLIKANFPARLAFKTASVIDSRVILDSRGAELLLGHGDSLYMHVGALKRLQGAFMDDTYLLKLLNSIRNRYPVKKDKQDFSTKSLNNNDNSDMNQRTVKKMSTNTKINLALWGTFFYTIFKMVKTILRVMFAPVTGTKIRNSGD